MSKRRKVDINVCDEAAAKYGGKCITRKYTNAKTKMEWECAECHHFIKDYDHVKQGQWCKKCAYQRVGDSMRLSIDHARALAIEKGWECLSTKYERNDSHLEWKCDKNHTWSASYGNIQQGHGCPTCANIRSGDIQRYSIEHAQILASEKGGECLSIEYMGSSSPLEWKCAEKHIWTACYNSIQQGSWCPLCFDKRRGDAQRFTIEHAQQLAASRGGSCISTEYVSCHSKLEWKCEFGHEWSNTYSHVASGQWCPKCAPNSPKSIEDVRRLVELKQGVCMSTEYDNNKSRLIVKCSDGHEWETNYACLQMGHWCHECGRSKPKTINDAHQLAASRRGSCTSTEYVSCHSKLGWRCEFGHEWNNTYSHVARGQWCPYCRKKSESLCRRVFEAIFKCLFPSNRNMIRNPETESFLELDGFNAILKLAFEYNGLQHYEFIPHFHRDSEALERQQYRDRLKHEYCALNDITLITIPHTYTHYKPRELVMFIHAELYDRSLISEHVDIDAIICELLVV